MIVCFFAMMEFASEADWTWITLLFALLGEVLGIVFVVRVLASGGSPSTTLLWVFVILSAPYLGLFLYYLLPRQIGMRRLRSRRAKMDWIESSFVGLGERGNPTFPPPFEENPISRLLCRIDDDAVHGGNRVEILPTGGEFFSKVEKQIAGAKEFVHFETYIFRPDATGIALLNALVHAARRGVEVRLLYDSFGSWGLKKKHLKDLLEADGKVASYLPILWKRRPFTMNFRNHRKLVVVDGTIAFLGGRNIGDEYSRDRWGVAQRVWLDAMVSVRGPVLPRLHRVFVEDWYNTTDEDLASRFYFPEVEPVPADDAVPSDDAVPADEALRADDAVPADAEGNDSKPLVGGRAAQSLLGGKPSVVGVVDSGPDRRARDLSRVLFQMFSMARKSLAISTPYLLPPPALAMAIEVAAVRGVRVRIHTNGPESEQWVLYQAQHSGYQSLLEAGVEVTETRGGDYNHAKMVIVDEEILFAGSANLDMRSARLNFEIGIVTLDEKLARDATRLFEARRANGKAISVRDLGRNVVGRTVEGLCRLLSPML